MSMLDDEKSSASHQALHEMPTEVCTANHVDALTPHISRREVLRRTAMGTAAALAGASALGALSANAEAHGSGTNLTEYFSILATGEAMSATFYSNAVANHRQLGIHGDDLEALQAIHAEEVMHLKFAQSYGGKLITTHFSFPQGAKTFKDRATFIATQQLVEELTSGALLAWIQSMAALGKPRLAQIGGQLMQVEGGHRLVGRFIMGVNPVPNWGFAPVALNDFLQVPAVVKKAGILSPRPGNDFVFKSANLGYPGVVHTTP